MTSLVEKLKRRSVFRTAAAYLAVAWLVLQVIDTISGMLELPVWLGPYSIAALAIGFPIALIMSWIYDVTPEGVRVADDATDAVPADRFGGRKIDFVIIGALLAVIVLLLIPTDESDIPQVSKYEQLTRSQIVFPPTPSPFPIVADGTRLYFNDFGGGLPGVLQLSRSGGEAAPFATDSADPDLFFNPLTISPDGANVIMNGFSPTVFATPQIWAFPTVGGTPRLLGVGADLEYSPDGKQVVFEDASATIHIANADLSDPREVASARPRAHWIRFSPDGARLRYTLMGQAKSIWEVPVEGGDPVPLLPEWRNIDHCCGNWTPDGSYFVFQATHDHRTQLWAVSESDGEISEPVQITRSALDFRRPTIDADGKRIFAISWQLRGEVVRFDESSGRFSRLPGFESLSAEWLSYSPDGEAVTYISYPEGNLWRSNKDGSERKQLTFPPMKAMSAAWSPNGDWLAVVAALPDRPPQVYLLPADGGQAEPLSAEIAFENSPSWTPDSGSIVFSRGRAPGLQVYELESGSVSTMPDTEGLWNARLSPGGKSLAAESREGLTLLDVAAGSRTVIADRREFPVDQFYWDSDGQHLFIVDPFWKGPERTVWRIDTSTGSRSEVANVDDVISAWGVMGMWIGIDPAGAPITLRDLSIHHVYALDWLP
ncbi:MAG: hypothetical protein QNJ00_07080 [Woeseiaceae bacterium]|nr:hypothetical protein [Woeseiaceae bacterium]